MKKILIVDDEASHRTMLKLHLEHEGYKTEEASNGLEALNLVKKHKFSVMLLDLKMDILDGLALLEIIRKQNIDLPVIVITAVGTIEKAVKATKLGAVDFITKPVDMNYLLELLKKIRPTKSINSEASKESFVFEGVFHHDSPMKDVVENLKLVAPTDAKILILGESGVGKEIVAKAIHKNSKRTNNPFIAVNCGAINENLIESELFGHVKGAFTGAINDRIGKFEEANGGTLFLDEIAELPLSSQVKLLRVLQEKTIEKIGSTKKIKVDVRIIAATNKDLKTLVEEGKFREDLFYRINVFPIIIPPLRDRKMDIPLLVDFFIKKYAKKYEKIILNTTNEFMDKLYKYNFPGNVRELENLIERAVIIARSEKLDIDLLPELKNSEDVTIDNLNINNKEIELIKTALRKAKGNKSKAANILGISRKSLYNKIKEYNINI
ncbi:MAG: sigma-54 dependent transcriptional regulator [Deferribacterota bacterium]|nr:sigma-54 dependent transcriptional regulator [Deferribacterota bacterium]